jgi:hypothetical protein
MPKPFHSIAFEHFTTATPDPLEAMMAFGLSMDSESKWARLQPAWPTEAKYRNYHHVYLTPHEIQGYIDVLEAIMGAFAWTIILIVFAIVLAWAGIDILEYYRRAAGEP